MGWEGIYIPGYVKACFVGHEQQLRIYNSIVHIFISSYKTSFVSLNNRFKLTQNSNSIWTKFYLVALEAKPTDTPVS